jgi:hypothetical protein
VVGIVANLGSQARRKLLGSFRPKRHTSMNDAENPFIEAPALELCPRIGTISPRAFVTSFRRMWRKRPQFG